MAYRSFGIDSHDLSGFIGLVDYFSYPRSKVDSRGLLGAASGDQITGGHEN
jgi:hypothetical protein